MSVAKESLKASEQAASPNPLRLLFGCLFLGLLFCIPISVYTNHVRATAATLTAALDSQSLPPEPAGTPNPAIPLPPGGAVAASSPTQSSHPNIEVKQKRTRTLAAKPVQKHKNNDYFASAKAQSSRRNLHRSPAVTTARGRRFSLSRTWAENRHFEASLIAIWHQDLRRRQITRPKATGP
jgi:hypothetical protein